MGFYPVMPGTRFLYDVDGTVVLRTRENNIWYEWPDIHKRITLSEDNRVVTFPTMVADKTIVAFVFPEPRDISAAFISACWNPYSGSFYHAQVGVTYPIICEYSSDTTNGSDGTWNTTSFVNANPLSSDIYIMYASLYPQLGVDETPPFNSITSLANSVLPFYRSRAKAPQDAMVSVTGIRIWMGPNGVITPVNAGSAPQGQRMAIQTIHLYGSYTSSGRNKLTTWHPTVDQPLGMSDVDLGDVEISGSYYREFRLKNLSSTHDALNVSVYVENTAAYLALSSFVDFRYNGTYYDSFVIPIVPKGSASVVIGVRIRIPYSAVMSTWPARVGFSVGTWR